MSEVNPARRLPPNHQPSNVQDTTKNKRTVSHALTAALSSASKTTASNSLEGRVSPSPPPNSSGASHKGKVFVLTEGLKGRVTVTNKEGKTGAIKREICSNLSTKRKLQHGQVMTPTKRATNCAKLIRNAA